MGVLRWTSVYALLVLAAVSGGAGCHNRSDDDSQGGGIAGNQARLGPGSGPGNKLPVDPGSPGLEPPDSMGEPGAVNGQGGAAGGSSTPSTPSTGGPMAGSGTAMGAAGSGNPGSMSSAGMGGSPPVVTADAGTTDAGTTDAGTTDAGMPDVCADAPDCGVLLPCEDPALHCIAFAPCMRAVCISSEAACQLQCGTSQCALLESYPEQIACQ